MDSKDNGERGSSSSGGGGDGGGDGAGFIEGVGVDHIYNEFLSYLSDATPPRDVELGAFPNGPPPGPPLTTQPPSPSNNSHYVQWATSSPTFVPLEIEDDEAPPRPPEIIAASFESEKADTIEDGDTALVPEQHVDASVEGHSDEEEKREEVDDDEENSMEFDSDSEGKRTATAAAGSMLLETIDDDDPAPTTFNSMEFDSDSEGKRTATAAAGSMLLETIDDDDPAPAPFNSMEFEDGPDPSKPNAMQRTNISDDDSTPIPVPEDIRDDSAEFRTGLASNRVPLFPAGRAGMGRDDGRNRDIDTHSHPMNAVESRTHPVNNNLRVAGEENEEVSVPDIVLEADVERDFTIHIPEATLVVERNEEVVFIATPVDPATPPESSVPWWKRRRTKFGEIIIILTAFAIAISQLVDKKDEPVAPVVAPTPSMPPTTVIPTSSPEASLESAWIWRPQGPVIIGDAANDGLGRSVALSSDAKTIAVGAPGPFYCSYTEKMGYVKVYRANEDGGDRVQLGQTIYGDAAGDFFGSSVDVSSDGNTLAIGSPGYSEMSDRPGYVRVFSLGSSNDLGTSSWKQIGQDIMGEEIGDEFGRYVSLSKDGKTLAIGAWYNDGNGENSGHVRFYQLDEDGTSWTQIGEDINGEGADNYFGASVSLSADGETVAIGAILAGSNMAGQVRVYRMDSGGSSWEALGQSIYGDVIGDFFGRSVDISPDGNTLVIGSMGFNENNDRPGYVRVFSLESSDNLGTASWKQIGQDIIGEANGDEFGCSVSISEDGKTIAIGAGFNDGSGRVNSGHVRVYQIDDSGSSWMQLGGDIDGETFADLSGNVSLSADGKTVAIGSPLNDDNGLDSGHVRIFAVE